MKYNDAWTELKYWLNMKIETNNKNGCVTSRAVAQRFQEVLTKVNELEERHE